MTESSEGANLANTIRGLKKFDGRNPAELKTWIKKLCVVISVTRRDILPLLKETARPTHTSNIAEYSRANEDLYAMLFLLVELPASLCVQKHENDDEISGDGQAAFKELCNTYDKVTDEVIRATMEELMNTPMEPGQNPDDYFNQKRLLRIRGEKMGEHISDRYFKDICVTGFTGNYKDVKMMMYRDPSFDVDQMQTTMRHTFLDEQSRNGTKRPHRWARQCHDSGDIGAGHHLPLVQESWALKERLPQVQVSDQTSWSSEVVLCPPDHHSPQRKMLQPRSNAPDQERERIPSVYKLHALHFRRQQGTHRRQYRAIPQR